MECLNKISRNVVFTVGALLLALVLAGCGGGGGSPAEPPGGGPDVPGAPVNVTVSPGDSELKVSWSPPPGSGGQALTGYEVQHRPASSGGWQASGGTGAAATSYSIRGLTNGESYEVQVRAVNSSGPGDWSAVARGTPRTSGSDVPGAPVNVKVSPDHSVLKVSWNPPPGSGGQALTGYEVQHRPASSGGWQASGGTGAAATSYSIRGLTNGESYEVRVRAVNSSGPGHWSEVARGTPRGGGSGIGIPGPPVGVAVVPLDARLLVSWDPPLDTGGRTLTGYEVQHRPAFSVGWHASGRTGAAVTSYSIRGLANGESYEVRVRAVTPSRAGEWSAPVLGMPRYDVPGPPVGVKVSPGDETLYVSWNPPQGSGGRSVTGYEVQHRPVSSGGWQASGGTGAAVTSYLIGGLTNGSSYEVQVRAVNSTGAGAWSAAARGTLLAQPPADGGVIWDVNLLAALRERLGKGPGEPVSASDMAGLRDFLGVDNKSIADLRGIEYAVNLQGLFMGYNNVIDISPLSELTNLNRLWINGNPIRDLSPLSELIGLTNLHIQSISVSDLSPLENLRNLQTLYLGFTGSPYDLSTLQNFSALRELHLTLAHASDISPLESLTSLRILDLSANRITDISPLENLTSLRTLNLRHNRITDISPLVANSGLGSGGSVDLRNNPLSEFSVGTHIPELRQRGVEVKFDEILVTVDDEARTYDDSIFILPVSIDLATETENFDISSYVASFYGRFRDEFDFLFIISNLDNREDRARPYIGASIVVRNNVRGIGKGIYPADSRSSYGSDRLLAVMHLTEREGITGGPVLHELMHTWGNDILPDPGGHWGFISPKGQLGGFDMADLVDLGGGRYRAGHFSPEGYADQSLPYSPIELYTAGFIPPGEVPPLRIAEDGAWATDENGGPVLENGEPVFTASSFSTHTIQDIIDAEGPRVPDSANSQKSFRAGVIFLIDSSHPATREQLDALSDDITWFTNPNNDDNTNYNFYEATGGRATITMGGLSGFEKE